MKLIIQIPCLNEAESLPITLRALPRQVPGFDTVEWLIIDDGSTDGTAEIARQYGVDHVIRHPKNKGLARAFMTGLDACLHLGADVIVNTDADNQYNADDIPLLVEPILSRRAEMVIGARPIDTIEHFSLTKRFLQRLGSRAVRVASGTDVADAPSGFRALSRTTAQQLILFSNYTYTLETIIQAGQKDITVVSVPIRVNEDLRPSRLVRSVPSYVRRSLVTIIRLLVVYRPFRFFGTVGIVLFTAGFLIGLRFLWAYANGNGEGHIQSVVLASVLLGMGFQTILIAFVADLLAANRKLLEDVRFQNARMPDRERARAVGASSVCAFPDHHRSEADEAPPQAARLREEG